MNLYALFLAAGEGRRFGGGKLLRPHRGRPLVAYALDVLAETKSRGLIAGGIAVIPDRNTALRQLARDRGLRVANNRDPGLGMSHSLRLGLESMDQFALEKVVEAWRNGAGPVVRPSYAADGGAPGHPVILARAAWPLVGMLTGDSGLGPLLSERPELVTTVAVEGMNPDIDTPEDLARLDER